LLISKKMHVAGLVPGKTVEFENPLGFEDPDEEY